MDIYPALLTLVSLSTQFLCSLCITTTGGYTTATNGIILTPSHPANYAPNLNRIWVIEAPTLQGVKLEIGPVAGDKDGSECNDYLEVRDGSQKSTLLFHSCSTSTNTTVTSTNRWLWVKFYSNWDVQNTGFGATWSHFARTNVNDSETSPRPKCRGNEIRCPNTECVTMSWRCDGFNDCGYEGEGSDEDWWCHTQAMSIGVKYAYGVSIGVVIFILLVVLVAWLDGRFGTTGRCARGPKACLGLDRKGPRTRRLPSYAGQTPAMLLLTGQHDKFEELAAREWEKKADMYQKRRNSAMDVEEAIAAREPEPIPPPEKPLTKPAAVQRKGQQQLQRMQAARDEIPEAPIPRDVKRTTRPRPWLKGSKEESSTKTKTKKAKKTIKDQEQAPLTDNQITESSNE